MNEIANAKALNAARDAAGATAQPPRSADYGVERIDTLPYNTPEKSARYRTERFPGAIGLNWYDCDPSLPGRCSNAGMSPAAVRRQQTFGDRQQNR